MFFKLMKFCVFCVESRSSIALQLFAEAPAAGIQVGWAVARWPDMTWPEPPSSQICVSVSPQTIPDKPINHEQPHKSTLSTLRSPPTSSLDPHLSFLDFINTTHRDALLLWWWDVTTLTEDWPANLTWIFECVQSLIQHTPKLEDMLQLHLALTDTN